MKLLAFEACLTALSFVLASFAEAVSADLRRQWEFDASRLVGQVAAFLWAAFLLGFVVSVGHGLILLARWVFA